MTTFEDELDAADRRLESLPLEQLSVLSGGRQLKIEAVRDQDRLLAVADQFARFPYGVLLWESAIVLGYVLADRGLVRGVEVLELGAGAGLGGIVAAGMGARVVQTDHSMEALALCRRNARANGVTGITLRYADWTSWSGPETADLVIGADILYDPDRHDDVWRVVQATVRPQGSVVLTDPGRTHADRFVAGMKATGWDVRIERRGVPALPPCQPGDTVPIDVIVAQRR